MRRFASRRPFLKLLCQLLHTIEKTAPNRWRGKRKEFQCLADHRAFLALRLELLIAAKLIETGMPFEFGAPGSPQPDLVLTSAGLGIELTTKTPQGLDSLQDKLMRELSERGLMVAVHLRFSEQVLRIPSGVERAIVSNTVEMAADRDTSPRRIEVRPAHDGRPSSACTISVNEVHAIGDIDVSHGVESPLLTGHLDEVEREVLAILNDEKKARQGLAMPAVLLVDVSRAGVAWLRPPKTWQARLAAELTHTSPFAAVGTVVQSLDTNEIHVYLALRPDGSAASAEISTLSTLLGWDSQPQIGP